MHILMSALQPRGGIRTFFRYVYGNEAFSDFAFTLVAPDEDLSAFLNEFLPADRIAVVPAESGKFSFMAQLRKLAADGDFDLVHSHGFSAGILSELALAGKRIPHLMTAHDVFTQAQFVGARGFLKRLIMGLVFKHIDGIHAVTEGAGNNLMRFFPVISADRVHGILHGVDTLFFRDGEAEDLKSGLGLGAETPLIGFFGRFMGQKGFRLIVDALKRIHDGRLLPVTPHVATFGWGGFVREDYAYLESLGLKDYFHQLPQTNNMPAAIKGVDMVAMPSRWEACGLLAMESLAAGVPIIGSNCEGLNEVLEGSPAKRLPVGDVQALVEAITDEINNLGERRETFLKYQPEAVERFSIDRPAKALADLYQQLSAKPV